MPETLSLTLAYLVPGFVGYVVVYRQCVPGHPLSDLEIAVRSLVWSLCLKLLPYLTRLIGHYSVE
jgi:hypothetical protein